MAIANTGYDMLIQTLRDNYPSEDPSIEKYENGCGFSIYFPKEQLGYSLLVSDNQPISFTAFSDLKTTVNERISVMYDINEQFGDFVWNFNTILDEITEHLKYQIYRIMKKYLMFLKD